MLQEKDEDCEKEKSPSRKEKGGRGKVELRAKINHHAGESKGGQPPKYSDWEQIVMPQWLVTSQKHEVRKGVKG